jgi:hypothetical protein
MGYAGLPLSPKTGKPALEREVLRTMSLSNEEINRWSKYRPAIGLAVIGGVNDLVPIDVDTKDPDVLAVVKRVLPRPNVARFGRKGYLAFYRGKVAGRLVMLTPDKRGKKRPLIDIKTNGNATIPPSLHRKTGKPYCWLKCDPDRPARTLFDTPVTELVEITEADIERLEKALERWCGPPKFEAPKGDL